MFENLMPLIFLVLFVAFHIIRIKKQSRGQGQQAFSSFELEPDEPEEPVLMDSEVFEDDFQERAGVQREARISVAEPESPALALNTGILESSLQVLNTDAPELKGKKPFPGCLLDLPPLKQGVVWKEILETPRGLQRG